MVEPTELEARTLKTKLELNLQAQQALAEERQARAETRQNLKVDIQTTQQAEFAMVSAYQGCPTPENRRRLTEARRDTEMSKRALTDFDLLSGHNDLPILTEEEAKLKKQLAELKTHKGPDSLAAEHKKLTEQLKVSLPRFLCLTAILFDVPPGRMGVEQTLKKQLEFRHTFETDYKNTREALGYE